MAAATATNGDAAASLDKIQAPPGIIIPPPGEIREAIEKTAGYVVRGGTGLEMRIRENHGTNPKFSFLMTDKDPYNAYYEWRKSEIKGGRGTAVAAGRAGEAAAPAKPVPKGPEKPPDFQFSARMPRMNQKDLEVLRLTALFVARNGRQFMTQLAQRENGNPQFSFLIPNHTFHNVFQSMIDQYSIILKEGGVGGDGQKAQQARMAELKKNVEDKFHVLARTKQRAEYARWLEAEKKKQEEEEEKKKTEFFSIDWNDFVLVETIVFTEADESINLPPPTTLNDLQYASLEEKNKVSLNSLRIEEAFPFEDTNYNAYPPQNYGVQGSPWQQNTATPENNGAYAPPSAPAGQTRSSREEEEAQRIKEREESRARVQQAQADARARVAPGKVKENYVPKAASRNLNRVQMTICPNCRQEIPLDEFDEHTRIELLDPRWKEQKAKADARAAPINVSVDVAQNLKRLASQRHDVFDPVTGQAISEEEQERRKRIALNSFDGSKVEPYKTKSHANPMQAVNVEEQIRHIHEKFAGDGK
ncbi:Splicing factor 3A subunit 1 [Coniochaeta hoffmannii]|uniref:Splicing factor 3A subunit 1 n=1 Tax=Coniochaeta hoffmannii TaxID=91930 RepID=A0AA38SA08_9PEZI|nr:Splicing factor 3A subunit 1 [Coniochaeta hoffmannii]